MKKLINNHKPLVTLITVVYNNVKFIRNAIVSVISQNYSNIEYIVVDGGSSDGTLDVINSFKEKISVIISEPDKGIYDAINKGINRSSGEFIAVLHSDDLFINDSVVSKMINEILISNSEICFSEMVIVDRLNDNTLRYYSAKYFKRWMLRFGYMPPHPTCFIKKLIFKEFGLYSTEYKIAGDFDFFVRIFYKRKIKFSFLEQVTIKMRSGGISNSGFNSKMSIIREISHSLKANNIWSLKIFQLLRYVIRIIEIIKKNKYKVD